MPLQSLHGLAGRQQRDARFPMLKFGKHFAEQALDYLRNPPQQINPA